MTKYSLEYSFVYLEPVCCSMSSSNCCFLTCIQISQEAGQVVWYSHLFQNFPVSCDPHKGFGIVNKAEIAVFLELSCFFDDPTDVGNLISGSSPFSVWTSGSSQFMYCWSLAWRILSITLLKCEMSAIVWWFEHSLALSFFGIGMKTDFPSPVATAEFSKFAGILSAALSQHPLLGFELLQLEFHHLH